MNFKADLQSEKTPFSIEIDKVGLQDVKKRIEINRKDGSYSINLNINAFVNLPGGQRGAHMSRSAESIDECITEHLYSPKKSIEEFGVDIARTLLNKHTYANKSIVELEGTMIIQMRQREGKESTQTAYYICSKIVCKRNPKNSIDEKYYSFEIWIGATAEGMIACPCGQEMSREFAWEMIRKRDDININDIDLEKILDIIPIATHNQRAIGTIKFQVPRPNVVDIFDIIETIENSMSGKISGILKRPDEAYLIRLVHQDPLFSEDVVRRMAYNLASTRFSAVPDDMKVELTLVSIESIHPHQVTASTRTTFGKIRQIIKNSQFL
ncbi:MAG: GTP cyclohydrolase MptA [Promethearchaeota archaeon]